MAETDLAPSVQAAYQDLYFGRWVDRMRFADALEATIKALAVNRRRHPTLYTVPVTDQEIGLDAFLSWRGYALEDYVSAARRRLEEES